MAIRTYGSLPGFNFYVVEHPNDIELGTETFDLACSLETLEHIPPEHVEQFLAQVARHLNGHLLVTVPNEIGPIFLVKWAIKHILRMSPKDYSFSEVFFEFLGRTDRVARKEHKGFDYRRMIDLIGKHFDVRRVTGFPLSYLPTWLCFSVGIVAETKSISQQTSQTVT